MVSKFSTVLGDSNLNIASMINQNRGNLAYNIIDVDGKVAEETLGSLKSIANVISVRPIYGEA